MARALGDRDLDGDDVAVGVGGLDAHGREPRHRVEPVLGLAERVVRVAVAGGERHPRAHRAGEIAGDAGDADLAEPADRAEVVGEVDGDDAARGVAVDAGGEPGVGVAGVLRGGDERVAHAVVRAVVERRAVGERQHLAQLAAQLGVGDAGDPHRGGRARALDDA